MSSIIHTGVIYLLVCLVNNKSYVGQTINYPNRIRAHRSGYSKSYISDAIAKHGWENFDAQILISGVPEEDLDSLEHHYICVFNTMAPHGYNLTEGGKHGSWTDEMRDAQANRMREVCDRNEHPFQSPEYRKSQSERMIKQRQDPEFIRRNRESLSGNNSPMRRPEVAEKQAQSLSRTMKKKWTPVWDARRRIVQPLKALGFCQSEVSKMTGLDRTMVHKVWWADGEKPSNISESHQLKWKPILDARRAKVQPLKAQGFTKNQVAKALGLTFSQVRKVWY